MKRLTTTALRLGGIVLLATLAGCKSTPPPPDYPPISFAEKGPIRLAVAAVEVSSDYASPGAKPNVEHLFPVRPVDAIEQWSRERLAASGTTRRAVVHIVDASVKEVELPRTTGLRGMVTTDQGWRYDGRLEVTVEILDNAGVARASATTRVERRRSAPEDLSVNDREKFWYQLTKDLMTDLDTALEQQIRESLGDYAAR